MKRIFSITICLSLILGLCACGSGFAMFKSITNPESPSTARRVELQSADDYDEVYKALKAARESSGSNYTMGVFRDDVMMEAAAEAPAATAAAADEDGAVSGGSDYSGTNVQVEGVDEGDIVKTDGRYIYIIRDTELIIVEAAAGDTIKLSEISVGREWESNYDEEDGNFETSSYPFAMYVSGTKLVVLSSYYYWESYQDSASGWIHNDNQRVDIAVYDVSDPKNPRLERTLGQDGNSLDSRMIDGSLYLLTTYYVYDEPDENDPGTFVPCVYRDGKAKLVSATDICIMPNISSTSYTIISVFDIETGYMSSNETVLGGGSTVYMNSENLFLARYIYDNGESEPYTSGIYTVTDYNDKSRTELMRFELSGGVKLAATGSVDGILDSQFSMDEHEGYLRIVTTVNENSYSIYHDEAMDFYNYKWGEDKTSNALYVLGAELNVVGSIEDLAPDEWVYSVRFDGDVGYFCTFRTVDPLFTVDLSSPENPKILSALKIPGFSEYLHVYGDGLLLGLGQDADEETGSTQGLKLSMFDTSDPANVTEKWKLSLDETYSEALYNHKAVLISMDRNIIAFPADSKYVIYSFSEDGGFYKRAVVDSADWGWNLRGMYIGDCVYVITDSKVTVLNMSDFTAIKQIEL